MKQEDFLINLIKNADNLLQTTLKESLDKNPAYAELVKKEADAATEFFDILSSLNKEQKEIIDSWIEKRDLLNAEYNTMSYIQGYLDCIRLLKIFK
jgi:uncharacterized iron-regulated protein